MPRLKTQRRYSLAVIVSAFLLITTTSAAIKAANGSLPLWADSKSRDMIIDFVASSTDKSSGKFLPVEQRIAVFDNDGTLWNEKPFYIHFAAILERMKAQLAKDPELAEREPWRSLQAKDMSYFAQLMEQETMGLDSLASQLMAAPYGGMSSDAYDSAVQQFAKEWVHPKYKVGMDGLIYQPMVELIEYLRAHEFIVYIFTADEDAFLKPFVEHLYDIPKERVFGSVVKHNYVKSNAGKGEFIRSYRIEWINNWAAKPAMIRRVMGERIPVLAFGNSNGDKHMLEYVASNGGLAMWVHHSDAKREDKYDKHTDQLLGLEKSGLITQINMAQDWKTIFPNK